MADNPSLIDKLVAENRALRDALLSMAAIAWGEDGLGLRCALCGMTAEWGEEFKHSDDCLLNPSRVITADRRPA